MAWDGGSVERLRVAYATKFAWCLKRVVERALLEMLGTFCAEKDEVAITPYFCVCDEGVVQRMDRHYIRDAIAGRMSPSLCPPGKGRSIGRLRASNRQQS